MADVVENGKASAVGNLVHSELPMTRYPEAIDKRGSNQTGGNENLNLHKNLEDYNMAEHVNAIADAVMAIQKTLGIAPQIATTEKDASGNIIKDATQLRNLMKTKTVKSRLDTIEDKNYDTRYGGPNWKAEDGQTLEGHKHTGKKGQPTKIDLTKEVTGLLPRQNINLAYNNVNGLTGANISINTSKPETLDSAIADKLSLSEGGTVKANLAVEGTVANRWERDYDSAILVGDKEVDTTSYNRATYKNLTGAHTFLNQKMTNLYFGRYVLIVRAKTNSLVNANLMQLSSRTANGTTAKYINLKGTEFKTANTWQNFYFVFDYNETLKNGGIRIDKLATSAAVKLSIDYAIVTPVHPAIFDR